MEKYTYTRYYCILIASHCSVFSSLRQSWLQLDRFLLILSRVTTLVDVHKAPCGLNVDVYRRFIFATKADKNHKNIKT